MTTFEQQSEAAQKMARTLKIRFPNLTTEETLKLVFQLIVDYETTVRPK